MPSKKNVIVIYGGKSTEHEVSCRSASFIIKNLDSDKFNINCVGINKEGDWCFQDTAKLMKSIDQVVPIKSENLIAEKDFKINSLLLSDILLKPFGIPKNEISNTIIIPIIHGTNGEDGRIQGFLELADIAFVGCSTLSSSLCIDKCIAKKLVKFEGIAVVPWVEKKFDHFVKNKEAFYEEAEKVLGYPIYVKPACLGSSVGISKAVTRKELKKSIDDAFSYDNKILLEKALDVREIECAVMGDDTPKISNPGEVVSPEDSFYTYEAKYIDKDAALIKVPADLGENKRKEAINLCEKIYLALDLYGLSRIDLFLDKDTDQFYFNEVNTIPGFTNISQFPLLWQEAGYKPNEILEELIELGFKRQKRKSQLKTNY